MKKKVNDQTDQTEVNRRILLQLNSITGNDGKEYKIAFLKESECCPLVPDSTEHIGPFQNELNFDILFFLFPLLWDPSGKQRLLFGLCSASVLKLE